jgi:hypothetical protein
MRLELGLILKIARPSAAKWWSQSGA